MTPEVMGCIAAGISVFYGFRRANAEHEAAQRQYEQHKARVDNAMRVLGVSAAKATASHASKARKCPGCGSHEWRQHNNVRICAYCRSGQ